MRSYPFSITPAKAGVHDTSAKMDSRLRGNDDEKGAGLGRLVTLLLLAAVMAAPLAACGKKGSLEPPPDSEYPRKYPSR